jgi:hypothetical protein
MNDETRDSLAMFVAHVAMLNQAIRKDASREQIIARLAQLDADATSLAGTLGRDDRTTADAVKEAWEHPARVIAELDARIRRQ